MTMPSVASLFGSDLVSGALRSTLNQVQKNCSFLNLKQLSKKERRKEKKLQRKLNRRYGFLKNSSHPQSPAYQALLTRSPLKKKNNKKSLNLETLSSPESGSELESTLKKTLPPSPGSLSDSEISDFGDFADDWGRDNPPLEFSQEGPQVSSFTLSLRDKYPSLNQDFGIKQKNRMDLPVHNKQEESSTKTFGVVEEASNDDVARENGASGKVQRQKEEDLINIFSPAKPFQNGKEIKIGKLNSDVSSSADSKIKDRRPEIGPQLPAQNGKGTKENGIEDEKKPDRKYTDCDIFSPKLPGVEPQKKIENGNGVKAPSLNGVVKKAMVQTNLTGFLQKQQQQSGTTTLKKKEDNNVVKLPEPKIVLYERSKIRPGWRTRMPIGCGFINLGNTCYMNATLQALFHTPAFLNWLLDEINERKHRDKCERNNQSMHQCTICPMSQSVFGVYNRNGNPFRPVHIHNKLRTIGKNFSYGRQEDAHEFLRLLLESMERSYLTPLNGHRLDNRSKETTPLGQIFGGYTRSEVRCLTCRHVSTTFHPHAELQLDIREVNNVEDALAFYFQKEKLENNDYKCEKCRTVQPATKQQFMELAPIVLCIQLKRFRACGSKIKKPIFINEKLNLSRFMFNRSSDRNPEAEYKLVGLVTHMGPSPNCGHYTAIAQASNGNYYQFDDSYVRMTSLNHAQNADAYVIMYETTNRKSGGMGSPKPSASATSTNESSPVSKLTVSSTSTTAPNSNVNAGPAPKVIPQTIPKPSLEKGKEEGNLAKKITPTIPTPKLPFVPRQLSNGNNFLKKSPSNNGMGVKKFSISGSPSLGPSAKIFSHSSNNNNNNSNSNNLPNNRFVSKEPQFKGSTNRFLTYATQNKTTPTKPLVPYPDDDDSDDEDSRSKTNSKSPSPGRTLTKSPVLGLGRQNGESGKKSPAEIEPSSSTTKVYQPPAPIQIKTWNASEESTLGKVLELDRKRPFLKSKEEIEDEEIDAGRSKKKPKSDGSDSSTLGMNPFDKASERFRRD